MIAGPAHLVRLAHAGFVFAREGVLAGIDTTLLPPTAREHETGVGEADEVGRTRDHNRQPECSATMPPLMR